jgi:hypothetical protein
LLRRLGQGTPLEGEGGPHQLGVEQFTTER